MAVFRAFFDHWGKVVHLCKLYLLSIVELLASATIRMPNILWAFCTILTFNFLHMYNITKFSFFGKKIRCFLRFSRISIAFLSFYPTFTVYNHSMCYLRNTPAKCCPYLLRSPALPRPFCKKFTQSCRNRLTNAAQSLIISTAKPPNFNKARIKHVLSRDRPGRHQYRRRNCR